MAILEKLQTAVVVNHEKVESRTPGAFVFLGPNLHLRSGSPFFREGTAIDDGLRN